jgi:prefoldin subunit 5
MNVQNLGLLDPSPGDPNGYVSKDMEWAAVPCGQKFIIVHKGQQVHTSNSYEEARDYINKKIKTSKKKSTSSLEQFL